MLVIGATTTVVVSEPLERVLKRLAKGRSLEECLVEELRGGLKAKKTSMEGFWLSLKKMGYEF